jgi:Tfp pilus assembly protein PilP
LKDKNQSSSLNQTNSDDELKNYIEQKKLERKIEIEQLRKEEKDPKINFKFNEVKKDLNCGMGFVNPHSMINQNSLGHSQSWRFKKQKKYNYYD